MYNKVAALQHIQDTLKRIGYSENSLVNDYNVTTTGNNVLKLDLVAFSDSIVHDTTTSCIAVQWCNNRTEKERYLNEAKYIATPVMLLPEVEKVEIWNVKVQQPTIILKLKYNELYPYFQENRFDFSCEKIIEAKYGFRQLSLFETLGLIEFAENANYQMLGEEFKNALYTGKSMLDKLNIKGEKNYRALTSITMHVLAAVILSHKLYPDERIQNIHFLIEKLSIKFSNYFNKDYIYKFGKITVQAIFDCLNKNIIYRNTNNEMLGHFYESTLFGENELDKDATRKTFGIYYTPKALGEDILNHIPIEYIDEDKRVILDGSCGSGSLLISAYKRLERLLPVNWTAKHKHDYLTSKINGIDIDRFAREVARLSLLLYSLPNGNNWNIITNNTLKIDKFVKMDYPTIIIGNPPFEEIRKGSQKQKALEFMTKYMEWLQPEGYIGIILPESFLENNSGAQIRKILLKDFDLLEIWSMPETIFKNNWATTVIIAQKSKKVEGEKYPVKIRIVSRNKNSIKRYLESKKTDFEFFFADQSDWLKNKKYVIKFSPLQEVLDKISTFRKLGEKTRHIQGIQIPLSKDYPYVSRAFQEGYSKYLQSATDCFEPYFINWEIQGGYKYIKYDERYKDDFAGLRLRTDFEDIYRSQKVLIKLSSPPGRFWRINAAIDRDICFPSHSFYCVIPKDDGVSLEELVAVINSKVINAFVGSAAIKRTLTVGVIKSIPIPNFSDEDKRNIITYVRKIEELKRSGDSNEVDTLVEALDEIVSKAFGLSESDIKLLDTYFRKRMGTETEKEESNTKLQRMWNYIGEVIDINFTSMTFIVSFVEYDGLKKVKITNNLPGWLLRKGACFTADLPEDSFDDSYVEIYNVKPLEYTYMNDEQLISYVENKISNEMEVVL